MGVLPELTVVGTNVDFVEPVKKIHDGADVQFFLQSRAYRDLTTFILQLNRAVVPRKHKLDGHVDIYQVFLVPQEQLDGRMIALHEFLEKLQVLTDQAPPDTGPRRFGNVSFRTWFKLLEDHLPILLAEMLPGSLHPALTEVSAYLLGSFGSAQRLDYGTGHELSFIVFLASLWKIGYFNVTGDDPLTSGSATVGQRESETLRHIVLYIFPAYLKLIRKLIVLYTLEPAGSHGVWGLDDNSFLPYMFGSAQFSQPLPFGEEGESTPTPTAGSLPSSPEPSIVTKQSLVEKEANGNLYFGAINFIYQVKRGPFWEHSPILFDISGIRDGWGKINKGLIKMYDAEVLAKFPVVQHFPFGGLFKWERDPDAKQPLTTPKPEAPLRSVGTAQASPSTQQMPGTKAPWLAGTSTTRPAPPGFVNGVTQAPWARPSSKSSSAQAQSFIAPQRLRPGDQLLSGRTPLGSNAASASTSGRSGNIQPKKEHAGPTTGQEDIPEEP